ncbi:MAG: coiled coil domain-containing protein [Desulfobacteraceae bacterium]|jgi:hypothetical protein|nr:coiled coil domain-containing protein [Desulfobacteraceae bacterium]
MTMKKEEIIQKMQEQLDDLNYRWSVERNKWEAQAQKSGAEAKKKFDKEIEQLRSLRRQMKEKIANLEVAGDNAWYDVKEGAENAWKELSEAFKKARSRF